MRVAVVILNWNGKSYLERFLPSVVEYSKPHEVVVADNDSTDDSIAFVESTYPSVTIVKNDVNGGFAKGYNDALKRIEADVYVLLNSDVEVSPNWIEPIISMMEQDASIGAAQPKILSEKERTHFEYAGAAGGYIDKDGYPFCAGRIFNEYEEDKGQYNEPREIFWASGASLFIRAKLYHEAGGLDEDFFAHMEEIDLCWRIKNRGFRVMYCPDSKVYHVGGGTLDQLNPRKTYLNFRNNLYLLIKNYRRSNLFFKMFWRLFLDGIAAAKFATEFKLDHTWAVLKSHFYFYLYLPKMLGKRWKLKKGLHHPTPHGMYQKSILAEFFFRKKRQFYKLDDSLL